MRFCGVLEQGKTGLLWSIFEGAPLKGRRVASFSNREEAWNYLEWRNAQLNHFIPPTAIDPAEQDSWQDLNDNE